MQLIKDFLSVSIALGYIFSSFAFSWLLYLGLAKQPMPNGGFYAFSIAVCWLVGIVCSFKIGLNYILNIMKWSK